MTITPASPGRRRPGLDVFTPAVGVVALVTFYLHGFNGKLSRDLAVYAYGGQQVADGVPPYLGILNRAGPLAHLIPGMGAVGARAVGIDDLLGMRLLFLLIAVACVCAVYVAGRDLFGSQAAGLAAAAALLSFSGFIEYAAGGPREKTPMVLFLVLSLWAMTRKRWFTAGVFLSLATLVLQIAFFAGIAALLVAALTQESGGRMRAVGRIVAGGALPAAVCVAYFAVVGALGEFVEAFVVINARFTSANAIDLANGADWDRLLGGFHLSLAIVLVGLAALLFLSLPALRRRSREQDPLVVTVAACGAATLAGLFWTLRDFDSWPDVFLLLPLAALGIGGLVKVVTDHLPGRAALVVTLAWLCVASTVALSFSVGQRDDRLVAQRRSVDAVLGLLPADATVLSIQAPQPLVLAGKTNPSRHQMFGSGLDTYVDETWPGGLEGYAGWIKRERPAVIAIGSSARKTWAPRIQPEYVRFGTAVGWIWYADRTLGDDVVSSLRRANRRLGPRTAAGG